MKQLKQIIMALYEQNIHHGELTDTNVMIKRPSLKDEVLNYVKHEQVQTKDMFSVYLIDFETAQISKNEVQKEEFYFLDKRGIGLLCAKYLFGCDYNYQEIDEETLKRIRKRVEKSDDVEGMKTHTLNMIKLSYTDKSI